MSCEQIFKSMMTESDNQTHDVFRYLAVLSVLVGLGLAIYAVGWKDQPFDMTQFGIGIGTLFTGVGAALKLKHDKDVSMQKLDNTGGETD